MANDHGSAFCDAQSTLLASKLSLQAAAKEGHLEVVEKLLEAKADVNAAAGWDGRTALQAAAEGGHLEVVEKLLGAKADVNAAAAWWYGRTALQAAAEGGHLEVVEKLLGAKADVNAAPVSRDGRTALQAAAERGHLKVVEKLLEAKADVNAAAGGWGGRTALQAAAEGGHLEVVEKLLGAKADVNAAAASDGGRTALQAAAERGHLEVVEKLLRAKADVNAAAASDGGRTALQAAAEGGHLEVVEKLLRAKANVNAAAGGGWGGRTAQQKSVWRKLGLSRSAVAESEVALQEAQDQLQPEEGDYDKMVDRLFREERELQEPVLRINRGFVSAQITQALTPAAEGTNSNGDDLPAVLPLHAKRPKKKRGLPGFVNGVRVAAMADTGASVNVISEAYAQKMRLEIVESDASYRLGNSRSGRCIGTTSLAWSFAEERSKIHQLICYVVPQCTYDLILGRGFLRATETMTKFRRRLTECIFATTGFFQFGFFGDGCQLLRGSLDKAGTILAVPDSGAERNVMDRKFALNHGFKIQTGQRHRGYLQFADGSYQETAGQVETYWTFETGKRIPVTFEVLEDCCYDVVLGENLLYEHDVFQKHASSLESYEPEEDAFDLAPFDFISSWQRSCGEILAKLKSKKTSDDVTERCLEGGPKKQADERRRREVWNYTYDFGSTASAEENAAENRRRREYDAQSTQQERMPCIPSIPTSHARPPEAQSHVAGSRNGALRIMPVTPTR